MTHLAEVRGECERQGLALKVEGLKLAPLRAEAEERRRSNKQMREQLGKSERERQRQRDEFAQELGAMGTPLCAKNKAAPVLHGSWPSRPLPGREAAAAGTDRSSQGSLSGMICGAEVEASGEPAAWPNQKPDPSGVLTHRQEATPLQEPR